MINKNTVAAVGGILLEAYNNTLYGYFAVILAPLFFSSKIGISPLIGSFIAFAAGYIMRPIGGILFGYLGDRFGRKISLTISSLITSLSVLIIAFLPTYDSIGYFAPIFLILCRLVQGIAIGGDYMGALIYIAEQKGFKNKNFIICIASSVGFFGASLGVIISLFFSTSLFFEGNWRYSFISAALFGAYISYIRWNMDESSIFKKLEIENKVEKNPLQTAFQYDKKKLFICFILAGANFIPIYLATVFVNSHLMKQLSTDHSYVLLNNFFIFLVTGLLIIFSAKIIEKFGELKVMKFCALWFLILSVPAYLVAYSYFSSFSMILLQLYLIIGNAMQISTLAILFPKIFPANRRYTSISFSYSCGTAVFGGFTPLIASSLVFLTDKLWSPVFYLLAFSILYWFAVLFVIKDRKSFLRNEKALPV